METFVVRRRVSVQATPAEVWDALTNPEKTKKYFFHCEVLSDWKVGSRITFKGKIFLIKNIEMHGRILQIEPEKMLKYTLKNGDDKDATTSTITDELTYENGMTNLSVSDDVGQGDGAQERYERSGKGWDKVLEGLKELVEKEK